MVFTQFGVAALAVGVVHLLEAAAKHPPMTKVAAALFFAIAGRVCPPATGSSWGVWSAGRKQRLLGVRIGSGPS